MHPVRTCFALACVIGVITASGVACDSFEGGDAPTSDGGTTDGTAAETSPPPDDAPSGTACEILTGQPTMIAAEAPVTALAADDVHVYWGSSQGTTRQSLAGSAEPIFRNLGACTDVVLTADHVVARFVGGAIRQVQKADITSDAGIPSANASNTIGLDPRSGTEYFARRGDSVYGCGVNLGCGRVIERASVSSVVPAAPTGFDYMAPHGAAAGGFHCKTLCGSPDASILLTTASTTSTKSASDTTFVYFLDRAAGALRKVPREAGAASADVITGLVEPVDFAIDAAGRFVVATLANGVFRGSPTGCVTPPTPTDNSTLGGFALSGSSVWYARGVEIMRVAQ
jgi:hypothetical protein